MYQDLIHLTELEFTVPDSADLEQTYRFAHVIIHDVIYQSLPHKVRTAFHEQIGRFIEESYPTQLGQHLDRLALHYAASDNTAKACEYLRRAGEAAQASYANEAAAEYYRRALPLLPAHERVEIMLKLGAVEQLVGRWDEAGAIFERALSQAQDLGDMAIQPWCHMAAGELFRKQGAYAEATARLKEARVEFAMFGNAQGLAQSLHASGTLAAQQGDYDLAQQFYQESMRIRRSLDDRDGVARLLNNMAIIATYQGKDDLARSLYEESLAIRRALGNRATIANSLNNLGVLLLEQDNDRDACPLLEEAVTLLRQIGDRWGLANALNDLAERVPSAG